MGKLVEGKQRWTREVDPSAKIFEYRPECRVTAESKSCKMMASELSNAPVEGVSRTLGVHGSGHYIQASFGYPIGLGPIRRYARFDTCDDTCLRVGAFKHGHVVMDPRSPGSESVVLGVRRDGKTHQERLWVESTASSSRTSPFAVDPDDLEHFVPVHKASGSSIRKRITLTPVSLAGFEATEDSDGEEMLLCGQCRLPVGTNVYADEDGTPLHGECMAVSMQRRFRADDEETRKKQYAEKMAMRDKFGIGWTPALIPINVGPAKRLNLDLAVAGHCCVRLVECAGGFKACALRTSDPAASINLEYLSTALKCRRDEGREPTFSLDLVVNSSAALECPKHQMQVKHFEPTWLSRTSVGDVLFQADYHLKELSMGESRQPVLGMKSCFDHLVSEAVDDATRRSEEWHAREWFVVRKAEMHMSEDDVLIPYVKMGVEAREQLLGANGLEDTPITRPHHPLVKYAQDFSNNFDLIVERKSVVYHLRQVAKASIVAKFILEAAVEIDDVWFDLAADTMNDQCMQVPQLWSERSVAEIHVEDGRILDSRKLLANERHGVYGGVQFGLDKFRLSAAAATRPGLVISKSTPPKLSLTVSDVRTIAGLVATMQSRAPAPEVAAEPGAVDKVAERPHVNAPTPPPASTRLSPSVMQGMRMAMPALAGRDARLTAPNLQGVDLSLDQFSLGEAVRVPAATAECGDVTLTRSFWNDLGLDSSAVFKPANGPVFQDIFDPNLSDRQIEGAMFLPPDSSPTYMVQLRSLLNNEDAVRQQRKAQFLSSTFSANQPGPLFPQTWTSSYEISHGALQGNCLHARPEYMSQASTLMNALRGLKPLFDKETEDGVRFRIYKVGSLEVRSTTTRRGEETIGAVYSIRSAPKTCMSLDRALDEEIIVKTTEYVEACQILTDELDFEGAAVYFSSYIVLETDQGNTIVTEKLADGTVAWEENPADIMERNALAKFVRSHAGGRTVRTGVSVKAVKAYRANEGMRYGHSHSGRKRYVQGAYNCARGHPERLDSGFGKSTHWNKQKELKNSQKEFRKEKFRAQIKAKRRADERMVEVNRMKVSNPVVIGSWTEWSQGETMIFDEQTQCWTIELCMGDSALESFQILCDNDWERCLHPDRPQVGKHDEYILRGPDGMGHEKNWIIEADATPHATEASMVYCIRLFITSDGFAKKVDWERKDVIVGDC